MSTRVNINVDAEGLLNLNARQQAASRQTYQQRIATEKTAAATQRQLEKERLRNGLDPVTGERLSSPGSSSRTQITNEEPAASRRDDLESFTFAPSIQGGIWRTSDPRAYELTVTSLSEVVNTNPIVAGDIEYRAIGGPGPSLPAVRTTALGWRSLGAENTVFVPRSANRGVTIEHWVDFGPHGTPLFNEDRNASVVSAISSSPIGLADGFGSANVYPEGPYIGLFTSVTASPLLEQFDGVYVSCRVSSDSGVFLISGSNSFLATKRVITGLNNSNNAGWNHFACEVSFGGAVQLYFNGQPVSTPDTQTTGTPFPITFASELDSFVPLLTGISQSYIGASLLGDDGTPRPYTDTHGVRYTKGLRYRGRPFVPPVIRR